MERNLIVREIDTLIGKRNSEVPSGNPAFYPDRLNTVQQPPTSQFGKLTIEQQERDHLRKGIKDVFKKNNESIKGLAILYSKDTSRQIPPQSHTYSEKENRLLFFRYYFTSLYPGLANEELIDLIVQQENKYQSENNKESISDEEMLILNYLSDFEVTRPELSELFRIFKDENFTDEQVFTIYETPYYYRDYINKKKSGYIPGNKSFKSFVAEIKRGEFYRPSPTMTIDPKPYLSTSIIAVSSAPFYPFARFLIETAGVISFVTDFIPIIGQIKSLGEALTGKDLITGEKLKTWQRVLGLAPFAIDRAGIIVKALGKTTLVAGEYSAKHGRSILLLLALRTVPNHTVKIEDLIVNVSDGIRQLSLVDKTVISAAAEEINKLGRFTPSTAQVKAFSEIQKVATAFNTEHIQTSAKIGSKLTRRSGDTGQHAILPPNTAPSKRLRTKSRKLPTSSIIRTKRKQIAQLSAVLLKLNPTKAAEVKKVLVELDKNLLSKNAKIAEIESRLTGFLNNSLREALGVNALRDSLASVYLESEFLIKEVKTIVRRGDNGPPVLDVVYKVTNKKRPQNKPIYVVGEAKNTNTPGDVYRRNNYKKDGSFEIDKSVIVNQNSEEWLFQRMMEMIQRKDSKMAKELFIASNEYRLDFIVTNSRMGAITKVSGNIDGVTDYFKNKKFQHLLAHDNKGFKF